MQNSWQVGLHQRAAMRCSHCKTEHMQTEGHGAGEGNFEGNKRTMLSFDLPRYITILFICDLERTSELCEHLAVHTEITNEID